MAKKKDAESIDVNQEDVDLAQAQEQLIKEQAVVKHLDERCTLLRAVANRQKQVIDELRAENKELKAKKRTPAKKKKLEAVPEPEPDTD